MAKNNAKSPKAIKETNGGPRFTPGQWVRHITDGIDESPGVVSHITVGIDGTIVYTVAWDRHNSEGYVDTMLEAWTEES